MSDLTEIEVIDRMRTSLREAIQAAGDLAVLPRKGPNYAKLREHLGLIEGSCRQLAVFRGDSRWYPIGQAVEKYHQMAMEWLSGIKDPMTGRRIFINEASKFKRFTVLKASLEAVDKFAESLRTEKTGKVGMILPNTPLAERRIGAPVSMSGLILPTRLSQ